MRSSRKPDRGVRKSSAGRFWLVLIFLAGCFVALIGRLVDLTILNRDFLVKQGKLRTFRMMEIPAYRGMISDRNNQPLAISTPVDSVWINPILFRPTALQLSQLAQALGIAPIEIEQQIHSALPEFPGAWGFLQTNKAQRGGAERAIAGKNPQDPRSSGRTRNFVYLRRGNPPEVTQQIANLKIPGVFFQREYKRYYPEAEVTAHLIGMTNVDDHGQEGLELAYDNWLSGKPGKKQVIKDRLGNVISEIALLKKPIQGRPMILSIDKRIQYAAYQALKTAVEQYQAEGGSVVVMDARTSEVLAMVNQPSYNPNNRPVQHDGRFRNRAVTDTFEPGSTIKTFTIALALQSGKYSANTLVDTNPGWMMIGGYRISDESYNFGLIDLGEILARSSNIGATKIMMSLPPQAHWNLLHRAGFGEVSGSLFPGESPGRLPMERWRPSELATMAYGYGLSVTTLQLAHAYTIFANGGVLRPLSLLKLAKIPVGEQVLPVALLIRLCNCLKRWCRMAIIIRVLARRFLVIEWVEKLALLISLGLMVMTGIIIIRLLWELRRYLIPG